MLHTVLLGSQSQSQCAMHWSELVSTAHSAHLRLHAALMKPSHCTLSGLSTVKSTHVAPHLMVVAFCILYQTIEAVILKLCKGVTQADSKLQSQQQSSSHKPL